VALIESEIRKHLSNPASAVFSGWNVSPMLVFSGCNFYPNDQKTGTGTVMVELPNRPVYQLWFFTLRQDGTLVLKADEMDQAGNLIAQKSTPEYTTRISDIDGMVETGASFIALFKTGNYEKIKAAIDGGANVNAMDENGDTLMHIAARKNFDPKIIKLLLNAGASFNLNDQNCKTPLDIYKQNKGNKESIEILTQREDDLHQETDIHE